MPEGVDRGTEDKWARRLVARRAGLMNRATRGVSIVLSISSPAPLDGHPYSNREGSSV